MELVLSRQTYFQYLRWKCKMTTKMYLTQKDDLMELMNPQMASDANAHMEKNL